VIEFTITSSYAPLALPNKTTAPQGTTPVSATNNPQTSASGPTVTSPISPSNLPTPTLSQGKEK